MATPPIFPTLPGVGWSVHKKQIWSTRVASHVSGREVRVPLYTTPLYEFELTVNALAAGQDFPGLDTNSFYTLSNFFNGQQGQFQTFTYSEVKERQFLGIGNGSTTSFTLPEVPTSVQNVYSPQTVLGPGAPFSDASGFADGSSFSQSSLPAWTYVQGGVINFQEAPPTGYVLLADYTVAYTCRFLDDDMDFEQFMQNLFKIGSVKFRTVKS